MAETVATDRGGAPADPGVDGRTARRDRNRAAVVDALLELYRDGNLRPSSLEIAELARMPSGRAASVLSAADVLCTFESHQLLRGDQGLSVAKARASLVEALTALLA